MKARAGLPRLMKAAAAAHYLGVGETTLRRWVREGKIKRPRHEGDNVLYDRHDLDDFADSLPRQLQPANDASPKARAV
ncbi:MAG: helix-turn-helix domain-containing protein [Pseudomonadota bacterium]